MRALMKMFRDIRTIALLAAALPALVTAQAPRGVDGPKMPAESAKQRGRATPIWTDHLKLTTDQSAAPIALGDRASLVMTIEPGDGMHVYAPGAVGYKVIALTVAPQPFVRVLPLQYPPSEIYVFAPLNERIPVYQKPFTLRQELALDDRPEARAAFRGKSALTVDGALDYQACDDKVCFNAVTVPLSWTLPLKSSVSPPPDQK